MGTILAHFEWRWTVSSIYISLQRGQLLILKPYLGARLRRRDQGGSLRIDMRQRYPQVSPDFAKSSPDLASHRLIWDVVVVREILPRPQLPVNRCFPILATAGFVTRARIVQVRMGRLTTSSIQSLLQTQGRCLAHIYFSNCVHNPQKATPTTTFTPSFSNNIPLPQHH